MQQEERQKNEEIKKQKYDSDIFPKQQESYEDVSTKEEHTELVEYNENIFKKIWSFIKGLFK